MATATITTAWNHSRSYSQAPHTLIEKGDNWELWRRANNTIVAFAFNGSKTVYNLGGSGTLSRLRDWCKENAAEKGEVPAPPKPPETTGGIQLKVFPAGARVRIPGLGINKVGSFSMGNLKPGTYSMEVSATGYETLKGSYEIMVGDPIPETARLKKIEEPEKPPIVEPGLTWDELSPAQQAAFNKAVEEMPSGAGSAMTADDIMLYMGLPSLVSVFGKLSLGLLNVAKIGFPKLAPLGTAGFLNILKTSPKTVVSVQKAVARNLVGEVAAGKITTTQFAKAIAGTKPGYLKLIAKELVDLSDEAYAAVMGKLTATKSGRIASVSLQPFLKELGRPALSKAAYTILQISQVVALPIIAIFAITEIPQLFLMSIFARTEFPTFVNFQLKKFEDTLETLFWTLKENIEDKDVGKAADTITAIRTTLGEYDAYITTGDFDGVPISKIMEDNNMLKGTQSMLAMFELKLEQAIEQEIPGVSLAELGEIEFHTDPKEALITVPGYEKTYRDGDVIKFGEGSLEAIATLEGYHPKTQKFYPKEGVKEKVSFVLLKLPDEPKPNQGRLQVSIYDKKTNAGIGATLFIDGAAQEYAVQTHTKDLDANTYELRIEKVGYKPYIDTIAIDVGKTTAIVVYLEKIPAIEPPIVPPIIPPIKPPEPEKGRINITTNPSAEVWSAGAKLAEETPATLELVQGIYSLKFTADGYKDKTYTAYLSAGETINISLTLTAIDEEEELPWLARVSINSDPIAAKILINGSFIEKYTPDSVLLEPGVYTIGIQKSRYKPWQETINLETE